MGRKAFGIILISILLLSFSIFYLYRSKLLDYTDHSNNGSNTEDVSVQFVQMKVNIERDISSQMQLLDVINYTVQPLEPSITSRNMSSDIYQQKWHSDTGDPKILQTSGKTSGDPQVAIKISYTLQTPTVNNFTYNFNPIQSQGANLKTFKTVIGPQERYNINNGDFTLKVVIHVWVEYPNPCGCPENKPPLINKTFSPFYLPFTLKNGKIIS